MDGRWKRWACAGLILGAVGCKSNSAQKPATPELLAAKQEPSLLEQAFGNHPKFAPEVAKPDVPTQVARDPNKPIEPETLCVLASAEVGAAFMEGKPATERDRLLDAARQKYQLALSRSPKHQGAMVGLAELYAKCGDRERAITTFQEAIQNNPKDHELVHKMAAIQIKFQDWEGAAQSCQLALSHDPENRTYTRLLGYCQAQLNQWQQAGETLLKVMPEAKARYFLGRVLIDQNKLEEGRQMIQQAAALDPEFQTAKDYLAELNGTPKPNTVQQADFSGGQPVSER